MDCPKYYFLEQYLLSEVSAAFRDHGYLTPEEFFAIVIWKANRAKGRIKRKLLKRGQDLASAVESLTRAIHGVATDEERIGMLLNEWGFALPMAGWGHFAIRKAGEAHSPVFQRVIAAHRRRHGRTG